MVVEERDMVTFLSVASHPTVPPNASTTALMGNKVLLFFMMGGESNVLVSPFTVKFLFPICRIMTVSFFSFRILLLSYGLK